MNNRLFFFFPSGKDLEGNKTTRNPPLFSMSLMTPMTSVSDMKWQLLQSVLLKREYNVWALPTLSLSPLLRSSFSSSWRNFLPWDFQLLPNLLEISEIFQICYVWEANSKKDKITNLVTAVRSWQIFSLKILVKFKVESLIFIYFIFAE